MKFSVRSNFRSDSQPSKFSIRSTLFIAKFKYSNFFSLFKFSKKNESVSKKQELNKSNHNLLNIFQVM